MKKLLVILLLLFPFHGALTESHIIDIQCTVDIQKEVAQSYRLNLQNNTVTFNSATGIFETDLVHTRDYFEWLTFTLTDGKKEYWHEFVNRITGKYVVKKSAYYDLSHKKYTIKDLPPLKPFTTGECKKYKGRLF